MNQQYAIIAEHVSKKYILYKNQKERMMNFFLGRRGEPFYALKDISFSLEKGHSLGLVGMNGSGKSTLSNIIAGLSMPTEGMIVTDGTPSLIAISSGLNNYLTGRENIELKGMMLGFSMNKINEIKPDIIDFADIGAFIDQPVKSYSSGMKSRLGFAIAVNINPDIMIIDEALSVGDQTFSRKCLDKMNSFKEQGKTIVFVSHSTGQVKSFCDTVMWLEYGTLRAYGSSEEIIPEYESFLKQYSSWTKKEQEAYKNRIIMQKTSGDLRD